MNKTIVSADLLTPKQVGELFNISASTVRSWLNNGKIAGFRVGGRFRVHRSDVEAMLTPVQPVIGEMPESKREIEARKAATEKILRDAGIL